MAPEVASRTRSAARPSFATTVERIGRARRLDAVYVVCPPTAAGAVRGAAGRNRCDRADPLPAHRRRGPTWCARRGPGRSTVWRGGLGGTTTFDEYTDCRLLNGFLSSVSADAVLSIPPAAPLIDPDLADRMIEQKQREGEDVHLIFTQAVPGVAGILLDREMIQEFRRARAPDRVDLQLQARQPSARPDLPTLLC